MDENKISEAPTVGGATISPKESNAYTLIPRELQESSLTQPDVVRMIIVERDKLEIENNQLKVSLSERHSLSVDIAVLREKLKTFTAFEIISVGTISIGSLIAGAGLSPLSYIKIGLGLALIVTGLVAKIIKIR